MFAKNFRSVSVAAFLPVAASLIGAVPAHADFRFTRSETFVSTVTKGAPQDIPARLLMPEGDGPFPAIVILHDCSGLGPRSSGAPERWAELLAKQGYASLLPDSFTPRGLPDGVCFAAISPQQRANASIPVRAADAYAALDRLRSLPHIDGAHIAVMGGSHGGSTALSAMVDPGVEPGVGSGAAQNPLAQAKHNGFAAGIAFYPGCGARYGGWSVTREFRDHGPVTSFRGVYKPIAPLLILVGALDDWTPAAHCAAMTAASAKAGYPVEINIYPGAYHSFDSRNPVRFIDGRNNANSPTGHGATTGGNAAAWGDSITRVKSFLAVHLGAPH